jgi:hypothetical protein
MALRDMKSKLDLTKRGVLGKKVRFTGPDEDIWMRDGLANPNQDPFNHPVATVVDEDGNVINDDHLAKLLEGDVYSSRIGAPSPAQSSLWKGGNPAEDLDLEGITQWPNNPLTTEGNHIFVHQGNTAYEPNQSYKQNKPEPGARF